jgi:hypothetical protein
MKKNLINSLLFMSLVLLFTACAEEDDDPGIDAREKFEGSWRCTETISGSNTTFTITISLKGESDSVRVSNFSGYGNTAVALGLVSGNRIDFPSQQIGITFIPVEGSGTYSSTGGNEKINMTYTTDGQPATAVCERD